MTPANIIKKAKSDGVMLTLSPHGTIKANGDGAAVNCWLAVIREHKAGIIEVMKAGTGDAAAVEQPKPDPFPDDRRTCNQCLNLRKLACSIAKPERGALVVANRGYRPVPDTLQRCEGYTPGAADDDRRPGRERWPALMQKGGG